MAIFEWVCKDCNVFWDRDCPIGKAPSRTRCPHCKKLCEKFWENSNIGVSFGDDKDFQTVRARYKKHAEKGFDKDSANRFLHRSIEDTRERINDGEFRYKKAEINYEKLAKDGKVKRLSSSERVDKIERAKKLADQAYDTANKLGYKTPGQAKLDPKKSK